jgi:hypothetical protein
MRGSRCSLEIADDLPDDVIDDLARAIRIAPEHQLPKTTSVDDLRDDLHSELASREAISAVPEICRRYGASISGIRRRIKSANFADLVSGLKRLRSAPSAASRPIAIGCASDQAALPQAVSARRRCYCPCGGDLLLQTRLVSGALPPSLEGATKAQRKAQERGS